MNSDRQETVQLEILKEDIQTVGAFIPVICFVVYSSVYLVVLCNRRFYYYPFYLGFLFSAAFDFGIKRVIFYKFVDEQCRSQIKYSL